MGKWTPTHLYISNGRFRISSAIFYGGLTSAGEPNVEKDARSVRSDVESTTT